MRQALGDCEELPDDWVTTATVIRETGGEVFGVSFGQVTDDGEMNKYRRVFRGRHC